MKIELSPETLQSLWLRSRELGISFDELCDKILQDYADKQQQSLFQNNF